MIHQDFVAPKNDWLKVSSGNTFVAVQLKSTGMILIRLAQGPASAAPADTSQGTLITDGGNFSVGGLPLDTDCWICSKRDENETVNVLAY